MSQLCDAPRFQPPETPSASDEAADEAYRSAEFELSCFKEGVRFNASLAATGAISRLGADRIEAKTREAAARHNMTPAEYITECLAEIIEEHFISPDTPEDAAQAAAEPIDWN